MSSAIFVRHGKASAFSSNADYDQLSPPGIEQSELLGAWLADERLTVDAVFVGPRKRHAQTHAGAVRVLASRGLHLPDPVVLPEFDEHDGITLVHKALPLAAADDPELKDVVEAIAKAGKPNADHIFAAFKRVTRRWARGNLNHDDVETWAAFRKRIAQGLEKVAAVGRGKTSLVFTSAGAVAAATAEAVGMVDEEKVLELSWSIWNGSMTELGFDGTRWGLRTFNATPHLRDRRLLTPV